MLSEKLGIDKRDIQILNLYMDNPKLSQQDIASKLKLSQPSINARINKLKLKGILNFDVGMDLNKSGLTMVRVDLTAKNPDEVLKKMNFCSFFVNGFITSGKNNVSLLYVAQDFQKIDEILTKHLRSDETISDISTTLMMSSVNEFIFKLDLNKEEVSPHCYKKNGCKDCKNPY